MASEDKYIVHKDLICFYSPFFDKAFNGRFLEGETQEMKLPEVSSAIFGIFVHWLYYQKYALSSLATQVK